ncbi:MAG: hypothetical protein HQ514_08320 [Rhodospirillales bacterium]|nr:hypothetical protein [Rhodospirillales bacterium]
MKTISALLTVALLVLAGAAHAAPGKRITVTGEVVDSWCQITGIMYGLGTAHHQCALWCAAGGIPVGIKGDDGKIYVVLKIDDDATSVANARLMRIQTHRVTAEGDFYERDGLHYLVVSRVVTDEGVVNHTHEEYGVQP